MKKDTTLSQDEMDEIYALLNTDHTAPRDLETLRPRQGKPLKATGHESKKTRELSRELLEEEPEPAAPKQKGKGLLIGLGIAELAALAGLVFWWLQWLR